MLCWQKLRCHGASHCSAATSTATATIQSRKRCISPHTTRIALHPKPIIDWISCSLAINQTRKAQSKRLCRAAAPIPICSGVVARTSGPARHPSRPPQLFNQDSLIIPSPSFDAPEKTFAACACPLAASKKVPIFPYRQVCSLPLSTHPVEHRLASPDSDSVHFGHSGKKFC